MKKRIITILVVAFILVICNFCFLTSTAKFSETMVTDVHSVYQKGMCCLGGHSFSQWMGSFTLRLQYIIRVNLDGDNVVTVNNGDYTTTYTSGAAVADANLIGACIAYSDTHDTFFTYPSQMGGSAENDPEGWSIKWQNLQKGKWALSTVIKRNLPYWGVNPSIIKTDSPTGLSRGFVTTVQQWLDQQGGSTSSVEPTANYTDPKTVIWSDGSTWIGPYSINKESGVKVKSASCSIGSITTWGTWSNGAISTGGSISNLPSNREFYLKVSNSDVSNQNINNVKIIFEGKNIYTAELKLWTSSSVVEEEYQHEATYTGGTKKGPDITLNLGNPDKPYGLIIEKRDKETNALISGAKFKVKRENSGDWIRWSGTGAIVLEGKNDFGSAGTLTTDSKGQVRINNLPAGTYHIYETGLPSGYDLRRQPGYDSKKGWVDIGIVQVGSTGFTKATIYNYRGGDPGGLKKVDSVTKKGISGIQFKLKLKSGNPQGASGWVKDEVTDLYLDGSAPNYNNKSDSKWFTNNENEAKVFVTDNSGFISAAGLVPGTYEIWEIKSAYWYDIEANSGYDSSKDWRYCGTVTVSANTTMNITIENIKTRGVLEIEKVDSIYDVVKLAGAGFKLKAETCEVSGFSGWLKGNKSTLYKERIGNILDPNDGGIFYTDSNGILHLEGIPYGTYHIYEVVMPEGYDMTKQDGYDAAKGWVDLGTITISLKDNHTAIKEIQYKNDKIVDKLTGFVWIDVPNANKTGISDSAFDSLWGTSSDERRLAGIPVQLCVNDEKGYVKTIATGKVTNGNGEYEFTKWDPDATATKKNNKRDDLYYWDLINAFVMFTYDNTEYVCVNPFEGGAAQVANNSKAKEWQLGEEKLDDRLLTGMSGDYATIGRAQTATFAERGLDPNQIIKKTYKNTDLSECGLTAYYNTRNYTVEYINLGLWNKLKPTFDIVQNIQYSKVKINGYTYTYDYNDGNKGQLDSNMVPETFKQNGAKTYGATIYPSDVEYTKVANPEEKGLQMYVVYKIDITNTTNVHWKKIYDEYMMYINSLVNTYDSERFSICSDTADRQSWKGSEYFGLWSSGTAVETNYSQTQYNLNGENVVTTGDKLSEGIAPGATKSVYIQFRTNQSYLEEMLTKNQEKLQEQMNRYATKSTTSIYHAYYRKDNVWDYNGSTHKYKESRGTEPLASGEFLHRTLDETKESAALLLVLKLGDTRIVSGTVFEDIETTPYNPENEIMQEALGNGILEDSEKNRASGVTVQLINAGEHNITKEATEVEIAKLYDESYPSGSMDAVAITGNDGRYVFSGVIPGLYYIRFTYSDGRTKMIDAEGNQIDLTSRDYKSTIIDKNGSSDATNLLYNATELGLDAAKTHMENWKAKSGIEQNSEADQKLVEWYKYLDDKKYNVATDDINLRNAVGEYIYIEADDHHSANIKDKTGTNDITSFSSVYSNSPYFSVSIENDDASLGQFNENIQIEDNTHRPIYDTFNFGLIRVPKTNIKLDKIISNIKLTNTIGSVLEQGDPSKMVNYVTALDKLTKGSKYVKVEMENSMIYGTGIETTYELTVKNISEEDYVEDQDNPRYGDYFKYGDKTNAYLKQLNLQELVDEIDKDYDLHDDTLAQVTYHPENAKPGIDAKDVNDVDMKVQYSNELGQNYLSLTKWNSLESGGYSIISYMAEGRFKEDLDLQYDNNVKVVSFQLAEGSTLQSEYQWSRYETTTISVSPDTGGNRNPIYFIVGAIALIALGTGIIIIKKKIIK